MSTAMLVARGDGTFQYFRYHPSVTAAAIFIAVFTLLTIVHGYQLFRTRTWFFIPVFLGGLCEVVGYCFRLVSAKEAYRHWTLVPYVLQIVLPLVAPALFAASIYMTLGRLVEVTESDRHLFIRRGWLTKIFVVGDVISFFMQGGGGGIMGGAKTLSGVKTGEDVLVGGLFVQIVFFGIFVIAAAIFNVRVWRDPTPRSAVVPYQRHMNALYGTSALILIRSVFRVVEFLQGNAGWLMRHEVMLYLFDALLMAGVMLWLAWVHPSEIRAYLRGGGFAKGVVMMKQPEVTYYERGDREHSDA